MILHEQCKLCQPFFLHFRQYSQWASSLFQLFWSLLMVKYNKSHSIWSKAKKKISMASRWGNSWTVVKNIATANLLMFCPQQSLKWKLQLTKVLFKICATSLSFFFSAWTVFCYKMWVIVSFLFIFIEAAHIYDNHFFGSGGSQGYTPLWRFTCKKWH